MKHLKRSLAAVLAAAAIAAITACSGESQPEAVQTGSSTPAPQAGNETQVPQPEATAPQSGTPDQTASSTEDDPTTRRGAPARVMELVFDDGSGPKSLRIITEPSPDLPDRPTEVAGVFVSREDNSILVGTGGISLNVEVRQEQGGAPQSQVTLGHDGPVVEVVTTRDTVMYRDETEMPNPRSGNVESGEHTIQQVVTPVHTLDELGTNTELQVWGERRGDRVIADVLVYRIVRA